MEKYKSKLKYLFLAIAVINTLASVQMLLDLNTSSDAVLCMTYILISSVSWFAVVYDFRFSNENK